MKKILNIIVLGLVLTSLGSCTKEYGYDFENGFEIGNITDSAGLSVDLNPRHIDRSKFTQARIFPGLVGDKESRLSNHKVLVDLNFIQVTSSDLRISVAPGSWQSTSMYAPAGELITIEVPAGIYGLTAQIGAHVNTSAEGIPVPQRDLTIYSRQLLFPGKNYLRNLYGGLVYILPAAPLGRQVELTFTGTVKAPSFKLGVTDPEQWKEEMKNTTIPWFELEGNRIVFTLETSKAKRIAISDPVLLMQTWDKSIKEGYWDWTGLTEGNPDPKHKAPFNKWRVVHDVLFKDGVAQVSGYPVRARNSDSYFRQAVTLDEVKYLNWGTYHELGHNMQQGSIWSVSGGDQMGEVTNNLYHFRVSRVHGKQSYKIKEIWDKNIAQQFIGSGKEWATMSQTVGSHQDIKLIFYAQIFEKYGYEFMTYLSRRARNARFTSANDQSRYDFFYEALCEYTSMDMLPFFTAWGWKISTISQDYVKNELDLPMLMRKVWLFNPVTLQGGDELNIDPSMFTLLPRTGWGITATNFHPSYPSSTLIDGNYTNFWHACYNATCNVAYNASNREWTLFLNTGALVQAKGIAIDQRRNGTNFNNHLKNLNIQISANNTNWKTLDPKQLTNSLTTQYVPFNESVTNEEFQYLRITINQNDLYNTAEFPALAEIGLFN